MGERGAWVRYEQFKRELRRRNLTPQEYETEIHAYLTGGTGKQQRGKSSRKVYENRGRNL
jgi:hypothetical protein